MHVRPRHCARLHRHVARMIKSAESFSGQAASVETTISLRARRGCQRRYTGPQAVARRRRAVLSNRLYALDKLKFYPASEITKLIRQLSYRTTIVATDRRG